MPGNVGRGAREWIYSCLLQLEAADPVALLLPF